MTLSRREISQRVARLEGELVHLLITNDSADHFRAALHQSVKASLMDVGVDDRSWAIEELNAALRDLKQPPLDAELGNGM